MTRSRLHLVLGVAVAVFIVAHLANHLALAYGPDSHIAVMKVLRAVYRQPLVEIGLIGVIAAQLAIGLWLAWRRGRPQGVWAWAQVISGGYLLFFLMQHVPAVFWTRAVFGLDTNIHFAAAVVHAAPLSYYFAPYYVLAVTAVFTHLSAALRFALWPRQVPWLWLGPLAGLIYGVWIVAQLMRVEVLSAYLH